MLSREWALRGALAVGGVLASLVILEVGLRVAAVFVGPRSVDSPLGLWRHTILCLGDSHTYGVHYTAEEAYPGQLQIELDRRAPGCYRVLNLGLPGTNSSEIRILLPAWLERHGAQTAIVCVGVNNRWNTSGTGLETERDAVHDWLYGVRSYRLARLLLVRLQAGEALPRHFTGRPAFERTTAKGRFGPGEEYRDAETGRLLMRHEGNLRTPPFDATQALSILWYDLAAIHSVCRGRGVRLVLLTYAAFPQPGQYPLRFRQNERVSEELLRFGRAHDLTVVDLRQRFSRLLANGVAWETYFMGRRHAHLNPRGYGEMAVALADLLEPAGDS